MQDASTASRVRLFRGLLRQVGYRVRLLDCATGLLVSVALAGGVLGCGVAADHLLPGGMGSTARKVVRNGLLLAEAGLVLWVLAMLVRRLNLRWLARQVERDEPAMYNDLTTAVEFQERAGQPIAELLLGRACRELRDADAHAGLRTRGLRWAGIATAGSAVLMLVVWASVPRTFGVSILRLLGFSDAPAPSRTELLAVRPGEGEAVSAGREETFEATVRDPGREVLLEIRRGNSSEVLDGDAVAMEPLGPSPTYSGAEGFSATWLADLTERTVSFRVVTGDAAMPWRRVRVLPVPGVERVVARVDWPAYTGRARRKQTGGNVEGLDGSAVSLEARVNLPVERALLELAGGRSFVMAVGDDRRSLRTRFRLAGDDRYRIRYWPAEMADPAESAEFEIRSLRDRPPTVRWRDPVDAVDVRADQTLQLGGEARDDFGIRQVAWEIRNGQDGARRFVVRDGVPGRLVVEPRLSVVAGQLGQPGQTVRLRWLAWDHHASHGPSVSQDRVVRIRPGDLTPALASTNRPDPPEAEPILPTGSDGAGGQRQDRSERDDSPRSSDRRETPVESGDSDSTEPQDDGQASAVPGAGGSSSGEDASQPGGNEPSDPEESADGNGTSEPQPASTLAGGQQQEGNPTGSTDRSGQPGESSASCQADQGDPSRGQSGKARRSGQARPAESGPTGEDGSGSEGSEAPAGDGRSSGESDSSEAGGQSGPTGPAGPDAGQSGQAGQSAGRLGGGRSGLRGADSAGGRIPQSGGPVTHEAGPDDPKDPAELARQARVEQLESIGRALKQAERMLEPPPDQRDLLRDLGIDRVELGQFVKGFREDIDATLREAKRDAAGEGSAGQAGPLGSGEVRRDGASRAEAVSGTVRSEAQRADDVRSQPVRNVAPRYQEQLEAYFRSVSESSTSSPEDRP